MNALIFFPDELGGILKKLSLEKYQPIFEEEEVNKLLLISPVACCNEIFILCDKYIMLFKEQK